MPNRCGHVALRDSTGNVITEMMLIRDCFHKRQSNPLSRCLNIEFRPDQSEIGPNNRLHCCYNNNVIWLQILTNLCILVLDIVAKRSSSFVAKYALLAKVVTFSYLDNIKIDNLDFEKPIEFIFYWFG